MAIAFFYAIGTAAGGIIGPLLFSSLVSTGKASDTAVAFCVGAALMILGGHRRDLPGREGRAAEPGRHRPAAHRGRRRILPPAHGPGAHRVTAAPRTHSGRPARAPADPGRLRRRAHPAARQAIQLATGRLPGRRACLVARVLGARHLAQAALTAVVPRPGTFAAGGEIDAVHATSMLLLAAASKPERRAALADALAEAAFAAAGLSISARRV